MEKEEEQRYWLKVLQELQGAGLGIAEIAAAIGVSDRQVLYYKTGERPRGMKAVLLHNLHLRRVLKAASVEEAA